MGCGLFPRGYLICEENRGFNQDLPKGWEVTIERGFSIWHDDAYSPVTVSKDDISITCIGTLLDPYRDSKNRNELLRESISPLQESRSSFIEYISSFSGRFVLFAQTDSGRFLVQDAAGTRSAFYSTGKEPLISSHSGLIAEILERAPSVRAQEFMETEAFQKNTDRYLPGIRTPYQDIKRLTPNTYLDIDDTSVERFFPRGPIEQNKITDSFVSSLAEVFRTQSVLLSEIAPIGVSVTAGVDSRLTSATLRDIRDEVYAYTLIYNDVAEKEAPIAADLCGQLGITHETIQCQENVSSDFLDGYKKTTAGVSHPFRGKIAKTLVDEYPSERIHLKSNVSEVARAFYRKRYLSLPEELDVEIGAHLYGHPNHSFAREAIREFLEVTDFTDSTYNYDPYDLYYWECKMGSWQSLCALEWDMAQDVVMPYNNRKTLRQMLSVPPEARKSDELYHRIINELWPACLDYPIDGHETPKDHLKTKLLPVMRYLEYTKNAALR